MKPKFRNSLALSSITLALFSSLAAQAATITWNGATNGVWDLNTNWSTNAVPTSGDDVIVLGPSNVAGALNLKFTTATSPTANSLTFTNTAATALTTVSTANVTLTIAAGGITTGTGAVTIGANSSSTGVNMTLSAVQSWNVGLGGLTVSNNISTAAIFTKTGQGTFTYNSGGAGGLGGGLALNGGSTVLDFVNLGTPTDLLVTGQALSFGGGLLTVNGKSSGTTSQTFGNVSVNSGGGQILVNPNGAALTTNVTLGSITATAAGSSLVVGKTAAATGTATITTTTDKDATGIYGGRVVFFNGTANTGYDWATTASGASPFTLSAYSGYTAMPLTGGSTTVNYSTSAGGLLSGALAVNTLKIVSSATALDIAGNTLTVNSGGLLSTGTTAQAINGTAAATRLTAGNGSGSFDLVVHQFNSGGLTIAAVIGNNGANPVSLVKAGSQNLTLTGTNTYTGSTIINGGGTVTGALDANFGSGGAIALNASASLGVGSVTYARALTLNSGAVVNFTAGGNPTFSGNVTGTGGIIMTNGFGTQLTFNGTGNTFEGPITIGSTGTSSQAYRMIFKSFADSATANGRIKFTASSVSHADGSVFEYTGTTALNLANRQIEIASGGATPTLGHQIRSNGTGSGTLTISTDLIVSSTTAQTLSLGGSLAGTFSGKIINGSGAGVVSVSKVLANTWTLSGANTYTGATTVNLGTLQAGVASVANVSGAFGNNSAITMANVASTNLNITGFNTQIGSLTGGGTTGGNVVLGAATLTVGGNNTSPAAYAGSVTGTGGLTKIGNGTLTLSSATTAYTGATSITGGTLTLSSTTAFASAVTVNAGTTLQYSPTATSSQAAAGAISLIGTLTYAPASNFYQVLSNTTNNKAVTVSGGSSIINISPGAAFAASTGGLYLDGGLQGSSALTVNATVNGFGLVVRRTNSTYSGTMTVNGTASATSGTGSGLVIGAVGTALSNASLTNNGTIELGDNTSGMGWAVSSGGAVNGTSVSIDALNGPGVVVGNMAAAASTRSLSLGNNGGTGSFSGVIANGTNNTLSLTKAGSGTQTLSGLNTFSGNVTVNGGTLIANNTESSGAPLGAANSTRSITVASGATLQLAQGKALKALFSSSNIPALIINGTVNDTNLSSPGNNPLGNVTLNNGTLTASVGNGSGYGSYNFNGTVTSTGTSLISSTAVVPITLSAASGNITTFDVQSGTLTVSAELGQITGVDAQISGLTKTGAGTMVLSGTNTYTGATLITGGTLTVSGTGNLNGSSGITINGSGAKYLRTSSVVGTAPVTLTQGTLTGSGTVGAVSVADSVNAIISNNNGVAGASLTTGALTFNGAATVNTFGNSPSAPLVVGALSTNAAGIVTINPANTAWAAGTYNLISYTGGSIGGAGFGQFALGTVSGLGARVIKTLADTGSAITLTVGVVDSPYWTGAANGNWNTTDTNWKLVSAGTDTLFIATDDVLFNDNATGTTTININAASVAPNSVTFNNTTSVPYTIGSSGGFGISTGSLTKNNTGTVNLGAANTYTGATAITAGTLNLTGSLTGTSITVSGSGVLTESSTGVIGGAISLTHSSSGTSILSGVNTYSGTTTISAGTLQLGDGTTGNDGTIASSPSIVNNAALVYNRFGTLSYGGIISGTGTVSKSGAGTQTLTGTNTYGGGTTLNAGTLSFTTGGVGTSGNITFAGNSTLQWGTSTTTDLSARLVINSGITATLDTGANNVTFATGIGAGGSGALTKIGSGTLTLAFANTYTGATNVNNGVVTIQNNASLGTAAGNTVVASGARVFIGTSSLATAEPFNIAGTGDAGTGAIHVGSSATGVALSGAITLSGNATMQFDGSTSVTLSGGVVLGSNTLTLSQSGTSTFSTTGISGVNGNVIKNTGGTTSFNAANTYTGTTTLNAGILVLGNTNVFGTTPGTNGTSGISMAATSSLQTSVAGVTTAAPITLSGVGDITFRAGVVAGSTLTLNGAIGGTTGNVVYTTTTGSFGNASSTFVLGAAGTYTGNTLISTGNGANNPVFLKAGTGIVNALPVTTVLTYDAIVGGGTGRTFQYDMNGNNQTLAGLSNLGVVPALRRTNFGNSGALATLTINNAANYTFGGSTTTTSTLSAQITGAIALTKSGAGTFTLGGTLTGGASAPGNTYTGATTILGGILVLGESISAQNSAFDTLNSIAGDATNGLRTTVTALTLGGLTGNKNFADVFTTATGGYSALTALTLNPGTGENNSYAADIGNGNGSLTLTKIGAGYQTFTGANTHIGVTAINVGGLVVAANNALGTTAGNTTVTAGASLGLSGGITYSTAETIVGSGTGIATAGGVFASLQRGFVQSVSGNNSYAGAIQINATGTSRFGTQTGAQLTLSGPITMAGGTTGVTVLFRLGDTDGDFVTLTNGGNNWDTATQIFTGNAGTGAGVKLGVNNGLPTAVPVTTFSGSGTGTTLDLAGFNQEVAGLSNTSNGSLNITNSLAATTSVLTLNPTVSRNFGTAGVILNGAGQIQLIKTGTFNQTLQTANTYTGGTLIKNGTLTLTTGNDRLATTGSVTLGDVTTVGKLIIGSSTAAINQTLAGLLTTGLGGSVVGANSTTDAVLTLDIATANAFGGTLGGGGTDENKLALTKAGNGSLTLTGVNTYTGTTTISGGQLTVDDGSIAASSNIINNATLEYKLNTNARTYSNVISGTGSLTKSGTNTLNLTGLNTYTGNTTVTVGTLALADNAQLKFVLGATSGTNNSITGAGALTLDGDFVIDTTAANALSSGTWTLVSNSTLAETYTANFTVSGFTDAGSNKWTKVNGSKLYTFDEATGVLTLVGSASYASWVAGFGLTGADALSTADPDFDGISNAVEMVLGGNPATSMDTALMPTIELVTDPVSTPAIPAGNYLLFTYRRSAISETSLVTAACETDTDLIGPWTTALDTVSGVVIQVDTNFTFTPAAPADTDRVRVYVPRGANPTLFGRLNVVVP